jgi:GntR family transcriptional regulator
LSFDIKDLTFDSKRPIYLQIVKHLKMQIHLGKLNNGDEVPSRRVLAAMLNINPATVQKAYKQMEDEYLITTMTNSKSIISIGEEGYSKLREELTENEVREFLKNAKSINLSFKDVIDLISKLWGEV